MVRLTPTSSPKRSSTLGMTLDIWSGRNERPFGSAWASAESDIAGESEVASGEDESGREIYKCEGIKAQMDERKGTLNVVSEDVV